MRAINCFVVCVFVLVNVDRCLSECILSINNDFGNPQPVFIRNNSFLTPNQVEGTILIEKNEAVLVACTGKRRRIVLGDVVTDFSLSKAHCQSNTTFRIEDWMGELKDIRCNSHPWFTAEDTKESCYGGRHVFRVGYKIDEKFYKLYESCFDRDLLTTLYVKHKLTPLSKHLQNGGARPHFVEGDMFNNIDVNRLYKMKSQKERLNLLLGDNMDMKYLTKNQFLTRGHLAARADFPLRFLQRASFHYINAAPQWIRGNAGDWAALEEAIRRRLQSYENSVLVYTGTYAVATLVSADGKQTELYLGDDDNNNRVVPVPLYFYKVVYDPENKTATAFVSINSPYYNETTLEELTFCSDICESNSKFKWLKWRPNDDTFSFCCEYNEFSKKIDYLPIAKVKGLFY